MQIFPMTASWASPVFFERGDIGMNRISQHEEVSSNRTHIYLLLGLFRGLSKLDFHKGVAESTTCNRAVMISEQENKSPVKAWNHVRTQTCLYGYIPVYVEM